jgi:hypothetical protein
MVMAFSTLFLHREGIPFDCGKESLLLVSLSDQSTGFLLWQHERSGGLLLEKGGGKRIERNHDPLVGIISHSRDNKRVHDGRFAEHFNLGRKGLVSIGGGGGCPYTLKG